MQLDGYRPAQHAVLIMHVGIIIDTIPNIGIGNANVNGNNPRFAYP